MPEIKNSFTQGKMNKDLDERLIPNGQYRDAMNVEVSTSEGSDVGTVQNIKGNTSASDAGGFDNTCRCVGSIADEKTNKLYWFVHCDTRDAIIEYNSVTGESFYILVDMFFLDPVNYGEGSPYPDVRQFLKFTGKQITGINIIDDFLFWTDGDNEPKKVNIKKAKAKRINSNHEFSFQHHSVTHSAAPNKVAYMQEEDLAVVKRKPLHAPLVTMRSSLSDPQESIFKKIFPRFCYRYKYDDGEYSAFSPFTDVVFKPGYSIIEGEYTEAGSPNYYDASTAYSTKEPYNTAMLNYVRAVDISGFNRPDTPTDVVQVDILYKQENSNVIYSIASIHRSDPEWDLEGNIALSELGLDNYTGYYKSIRGRYTIETENIHAALPESQLLRPWDNVPKKALAQDVSGNRIVYGNYTQGYDVYNTPTTLTQIRTRRDDQDTGIIRSLKSQREYQVGILFGDKYGRETPIFAGDGQSVNWDGYYRDDFDRSEYHLAASTPTALESRITSAVPDWADYFKFYIKQTSGEYYNLVMDRAYLPHQTTEVSPGYDEHLWLSFSSQDRNKISEEDYIIMKRSLEYSDQQISQPNRYKILDIKNEAPDAISYKFYSMGTYANNSDGVIKGADGIFTANPAHATAPQNQRIDREVDVIHINKTNWVTELSDVSPLGDGAELINTDLNQDIKDLYASWSVRGVNSLRYKVLSVSLEAEKYIIKLAKTITAEDAELARIAGTNPQSNLDHDVIFRIERREKWANENFSGKFFVKIATNDLVFEYVAGETFDITGESNVVANAKTFFWADKPVTTGEQEVDGIVNSESYGSIVDGYYGGDSETPNSIHGIGNITNTAAAWQALLLDGGDDAAGIVGRGASNGTWGAIIDAMYFAGGNAGADEYNGLNSFAKESGQTMLGNSTLEYPIQSWGYRQSSFESSGIQYYDYGFRISGQATSDSELMGGSFNVDGNLAQAAIQYIGTTDAENRAVAVNGLEGIVNASGPHVAGSADGYRRFVNGSLYDPVARVNRIYGDSNDVLGYTQSGKTYIHFSFPECGVDLHDGIFPSDMAIFGLNGIAAHLQAIWGGGCFSNFDGTKLGTSGRQFVNMEDHVVIQDLTNGVPFGATPYFEVGEGAPTAPGPGVGLTWNQLTTSTGILAGSNPNAYWQTKGLVQVLFVLKH